MVTMNEFNSQVCTTKIQSQHLLDLGLKPETSDMVLFKSYDLPQYPVDYTFNQDPNALVNCIYVPMIKGNQPFIQEGNIPSWSLHRLKCLLPTKIPYKSGYLTTEIINNVNLMFITDTSEQRLISFIHENLYESMIKGITWLIKEDYFNKEYLKQ